MWKPEHRRAAERNGLRYPSDLSDAEWAIAGPMIPPARHGGRKRSVNLREILNGIFYGLSTGCQWQALPKDLPPKSTVHHYFMLWDWDGTLERIHHSQPVADLFHMQDEIVARLANQLGTQLIAAEARRAEKAPHPDSMDLYFKVRLA